MKVIDTYLTHIGPTPSEIIELRRNISQFHQQYGRPVIFKHRWNLDDESKGLTVKCPHTYNYSYQRDKTSCPFCWGTSFLGGFQDGVILMTTIADAPVDQLKIGERGYILYDKHPQLTAPWYPTMGDGDLIIDAEFDRSTWEVLSTGDRFELNNVSPVTVRGLWGPWTDYTLYKIQQTAEIDRLPNQHVFYNVPVEFDYNSAPPASFDGLDTNVFPYNYNAYISVPLMLVGQKGILSSSDSINLYLVGQGTFAQNTVYLKLTGEASSQTFFEPNNPSSVTQSLRISA